MQKEIKRDYKTKIELLKKIRQTIRKKRFVIDETQDHFGFDSLKLLTKVKNTSEVKGYPFVANKIVSKTLEGTKMGLKIIPIETKYAKDEHPCTLEMSHLKELTDNVVLKNKSPHIAFYLGSQKIPNKSRAIKFLNLKRLEIEELIRTNSWILMSEFVEGGSLDNWVYDINDAGESITPDQWKGIAFQMLYTISILQNDYKMMHNDLHYGNILMDNTLKPEGYFVYRLRNKTYYIKNLGTIPKAWDLEYSSCYSNSFFPNKYIINTDIYDRKAFKTVIPDGMNVIKKIRETETESEEESSICVPYNYDTIYDPHYFLTSLLDLFISQELFDWIISVYPEELIPKDPCSERSSNSSNSSSSNASSNASSSNSSSNIVQSVGSEIVSEINSQLSEENVGSEIGSDTESSDSDTGTESSNTESSDTGTESSLSYYDEYLKEGRLKAGVIDLFPDLPGPNELLESGFFDSLCQVPEDFDESTAIYFDAGF